MIIRIWQTQVLPHRMAEYEENERTRSTPMFRQQYGCLGVFFLRSEGKCQAITFWKDWDSVNRLAQSDTYQDASHFYEKSGMLVGQPSLQIFEVKGGFLLPEILKLSST